MQGRDRCFPRERPPSPLCSDISPPRRRMLPFYDAAFTQQASPWEIVGAVLVHTAVLNEKASRPPTSTRPLSSLCKTHNPMTLLFEINGVTWESFRGCTVESVPLPLLPPVMMLLMMRPVPGSFACPLLILFFRCSTDELFRQRLLAVMLGTSG
jgi:hypothetical protein